MNGDQRFSALFSLAMVLATATLGWMSFRTREVPPVADTRTISQVPEDEQDVVARLWEDPLQAVQADAMKHSRAQTSELHSFAEVNRLVLERAANRQICLLVVPIPDTPFPDDLEVRLRLRYSIQMALAEENYAPENRSGLGYFYLPRETSATKAISSLAAGRSLCCWGGSDSTVKDTTDALVPYEWFKMRKSESGTYIGVLVLWLPESRLGKHSLECLEGLRKLADDPKGASSKDNLAGIFVIGPRSSDTLVDIVSAAKAAADCTGKRGDNSNDKSDSQDALALLRGKLSIFSPQATTPDALLDLVPQPLWSDARKDLEDRLEKALGAGGDKEHPWRYFNNLIAPDDQLTDLLVKELGTRGFNFSSDSQEKILILAEEDTAYGRSLPLAFQASVATYKRNKISFDLDGNTRSETPVEIQKLHEELLPKGPLLIYRYLKGLDLQKGQPVDDKEQSRVTSKSPEEALSALLKRQGAMALGESQLDYANRLADTIKDGPDAENIKAVGVLGADIYDKLVLLRSLRLKFPDAVFFTTDIDARLWHPNHFSFTRNMLVASAHGIRADGQAPGPGPVLQSPKDELSSSTISPFRDGYQVAVFRACRAALKRAADKTYIPHPPPAPIVFEVSRQGPIALVSETTKAEVPLDAIENAMFANVKQGILDTNYRGWSLLILSGATVLGLIASNKRIKTGRWPIIRLKTLVSTSCHWIWSASVSVVLLLLFYFTSKGLAIRPGGEPWSWTLGVSVWPTELIRLSIILAVITAFFWAWKHYTASRARLIAEFSLTDPRSRAYSRQGLFSPVFEPWTKVHGTEDNATISAIDLFYVYVGKAQWACRLIRVIPAAAAYVLLLFGMAFFVRTPDSTLARGVVARELDRYLGLSAIIIFIVLLFYVLDAVTLTARLLYGISGPLTKWPEKLTSEQRLHYNVEQTDLSGYLDVRFAAEKSQETGRLVFLPFIIQFLFIVSRNSYFDNWSWPPILFFVYVCNITLACAAWVILRGTARAIREEAVAKLQSAIEHVTHRIEIEEITFRARMMHKEHSEPPSHSGERPDDSISAAYSKQKARLKGLQTLLFRVNEEHRGAYARLFQDPALIAMLLPTGLLGILTVIFRAFFGSA